MPRSTVDQYILVCPICRREFDIARAQTFCVECRSPLLTQYDLDGLRAVLDREEIRQRQRGMWRWHELLPVIDHKYRVTLGEGDTPLLRLPRLGEALGLNNLLIKDESINPTLSFKARGMAVAVSKAMELGVTEFVIPTAGNAGGALAHYAGRAGCRAHVFMPADTPLPIQNEVQAAGADLHLVDGLISDAAKLAADSAARYGWFDVSTFKEPFRLEGKKIMGYEIAEAMNWVLPDIIIYPIGGGTGLVGVWKAFSEMQALGWIDERRPRMIAVQADGCAPVVRAFQTGADRIEPWANADTIAYGLRVPAVFADRLVLTCLRESEGLAMSVSDEDILFAQDELTRLEGILASPEGAATLSGLIKLLRDNLGLDNKKIVLFNTGSGLKYYQGKKASG